MGDIAIITARGGSKRIPHKNIKQFCGVPILQYSIEAALESGIFRHVMVSTDDENIAVLARTLGAEVPFMRSGAMSDDHATTAEVLVEVLTQYEERGEMFDYFCCIYPTAPFITAKRLGDAMRVLKEHGADTLLPVVKFSFPPQRSVILDHHGRVKMAQPENLNMRSQDLEPMYHDCGQFYCGKSSVFLTTPKLITDNTIPYILPEAEVQDIDNQEDWLIAEMKYKILMERKNGDK